MPAVTKSDCWPSRYQPLYSLGHRRPAEEGEMHLVGVTDEGELDPTVGDNLTMPTVGIVLKHQYDAGNLRHCTDLRIAIGGLKRKHNVTPWVGDISCFSCTFDVH